MQKRLVLWWYVGVLVVCAGFFACGMLMEVDEVGAHFLGWKWSVHCLLDGAGGGECEWCGLTRSFEAAVKGNLRQAISHGGGIGVLVMAFMLCQVGYSSVAIWRWPRRMRKKLRRWNLYVIGAAVAGAIVWLLR